MSEEMLIVVDKKDEVIDHLPRSMCHRTPYPIHREIFVVLRDGSGKVWLQLRSKKKEQYPGYWTVTATGHVAMGQGYEEAAKRELLEEVGVEIELRRGRKWLYEREGNRAMIQIFVGEYEGGFELDKEEVSEVKSFQGKELVKMKDRITPAARECLMMLKLLKEDK